MLSINKSTLLIFKIPAILYKSFKLGYLLKLEGFTVYQCTISADLSECWVVLNCGWWKKQCLQDAVAF